MMTEEEPVSIIQNSVQVNGVYKSYGSGKKKLLVLKDLDMMVPRGAIYGLLGPSGCGKTTLLRCILGRLKVDDGDVTVCGQKPGSPGHQVPGRMVGYMPQELALYNKFTIGETLSYFGRLHKMTASRVRERTEFLLEFLTLPEESRQIEQLSGGQQRRTSFAIALLQEPEVLILDEPTVGVDPLLRQRIWEHLLEISSSGNVTIIITTHYVDEAKQAHMVGLMRSGRMLAEAAPSELLEAYEMDSLEEVFLTLCEHDQSGDIYQNGRGREEASSATLALRAKTRARKSDMQRRSEMAGLLGDDVDDVTPEDSGCGAKCRKHYTFRLSLGNIIALFIKNIINLKRNIGFLLFEFFLPALQITLFCLCIGRAPYDLKMGVVNNDTCAENLPCASTLFLNALSNDTFNLMNSSQDFQSAVHEVEIGNSWGVLNIGENFTTDLLKRFIQKKVDNKTLEGSTVHVYLDMTNQQVSFTVQQKLLEGFQRFTEEELSQYGLNPASAEIPIKIEGPIYGDANPSFTNFMAPGVILSVTFFMATGLTALSFVLERKQGLMDRSFVAGVNTVEIMIGHICTQFLVMFVQVGLLLAFALGIFSVPCDGSVVLLIILALLQGLAGMALGLLISTLCTEETAAIQCSLGSVYPNMLLSGIIWPLEGMPVWLRYFSYGLPMTFAAEAMRSIMARGWGLLFLQVWRGFVVSIAWGWVLMFLSAVILIVRGE